MTDRELLQEIHARLTTYLNPAEPEPAPTTDILVPAGSSLQAAWDAAPPGATLLLEPGAVFGSLVARPKPGATKDRRITVTTRDWRDRGVGLLGLAGTKLGRVHMATIRPTAGYGIDVPNGDDGAGCLRLVGVAVDPVGPAGAGTSIRIGSASETNPARMARWVSLKQVHIAGDPIFGTKRGVEANGADIDIDQLWAEEFFIGGQDTQAICAWNGGHRVWIRNSYLSAGAENLLLGGSKPAARGMVPSDWLVEDCILHKPDRWRLDGRPRQVKNLLEIKHANRVTVRRCLLEGNWAAAQDGFGIVVTYVTQGNSPESQGIRDVVFEDVALLRSPGAVNMSGHSYFADSNNADRLQGLTFRNFYYVQGENGISRRVLMLANVKGRHDIAFERSTFLHRSGTFFVGDYGKVWEGTPPVLAAGGPMQGFRLESSILSQVGTYQFTAPAGLHYGTGLATFVNADLMIRGNVIGGAPSSLINRLNTMGGGNRSAAAEEVDAMLADPERMRALNLGADIGAVLAMRTYLPEP